MRLDQEDTNAYNTHLKSVRYSYSAKVLAGDAYLTLKGSLVNGFDPAGAARTVWLPELESGRFFVVQNVGVSGSLVVKDLGGGTVATVGAGTTAMIFGGETAWLASQGGGAIGIFTNTTSGLVPAPNSAVPGSKVLRDDAQWVDLPSGGVWLTDAFKFMTDGTNTAIGAGADTFRFRSSTGKIGVTVANDQVTFGDNLDLTVNEGAVNHNALLNYVANEHINHTSVTLTAGSGLTGGGTIAANRTFALDLNNLTVDTPVLADSFPFYDASGADTNKATLTTLNGILDHNALLNYVANQHIDHTTVSITASTGLSGGGTIAASRSIALDINGLTVDTLAAGDFLPFYDISGGDTNKVSITNLTSAIDHNTTLNYVAAQHVDHTTVSISPGTGLSGGGTIAATRTLSLDINGLAVDTPVLGDSIPFYDLSGGDINKTTLTVLNGIIDHNSLLNYDPDKHFADVPNDGITYARKNKAWSGLPVIGDVVGPAASVDGEIALYSGTTGKLLKRAAMSGIVKATSGVAGTAVAGTDYCAATTGSSVLKGSSGSTTAATVGTDYMGGGANPTATIGLTANNGSATTGMRSDASPALSQAITPTWTGAHTFANTVTTFSASNAGLEIGAQGSTNTPFLDFHSGATTVDYDARILASGGTGTAGQGSLTVTATSVTFSNTITVTGASTFDGQASSPLQTLTVAATLGTWDCSLGQKAKVTLNQAGHTMAAPTNLVEGTTYFLWVIQDGTGSRTITTWNAAFDFGAAGAPTLTTTASRADLLTFECITIAATTKMRYTGIAKGFS